ncbi:MAG: YjgN family protein [Candidatus Methylomirabilales bacterium]
MTIGMTCPKCGLMQLSAPTCKSCGAATGRAAIRLPRPTQSAGPPRPAPSPPAPRLDSADAPPLVDGPAPAGWTPPADGFPDGVPKLREFAFHGSGGSLFGIFLVNMVLTLVTFGVYRFWATTRVRRYLMSQTEFEGDRFAYHGTGRELWLGFARAFALYWLPLILLNTLAAYFLGPTGSLAVAALTPIVFLLVIPVAIVGARRYRLSRTSWRGIRFSFRGNTREFVNLFIGGVLLSVLTLGLYTPVFLVKKHAFLLSHSYFGSVKAEFDGENRGLFTSFLLALLLTPFTLGLCWFWFVARKQRYLWAHTGIGDARFDCGVTGGRLLGLHAVNLLLLAVTLGLGRPWVLVRTLRFTLSYLTLEGPLDFAAVEQEAQAASATGEALAGMLDAGFDVS